MVKLSALQRLQENTCIRMNLPSVKIDSFHNRNLDQQLFNKANEIQEEISRKR